MVFNEKVLCPKCFKWAYRVDDFQHKCRKDKIVNVKINTNESSNQLCPKCFKWIRLDRLGEKYTHRCTKVTTIE